MKHVDRGDCARCFIVCRCALLREQARVRDNDAQLPVVDEPAPMAPCATPVEG